MKRFDARGLLRQASAACMLAISACASLETGAALAEPAARADRQPEDEVIYFVLPDRFENGEPANDRGGLQGDRLVTGFDPTNNGFYHGGDLKGLTARLDYLQGLGITAIWLTPIFRNKPVQGPPGAQSSGYHGYWITDFLNIDPHLGTREEFRAFVEAAHAREMKVYMDIITNHTADVIQYEEGGTAAALGDDWVGDPCAYRPVGDYPWTRRGGADGAPINDGFLGLDRRHQTPENLSRLTDPRWAYTPVVPEAERGVKNPAWLNDPIYYHNRGNSAFEGENSLLGDFAGLDDLMTGNPAVVAGFIDIYRQWISDFRVDGFRIDTAKHVNPEFWQAFIPAMAEHARAEGIEHFHIFGEVYEFDPAQLARFTVYDGIPTVLDFAFQGAARSVVVDGAPARTFERLFIADPVYARGEATARQLPTFLGNHDMGRLAGMLADAHPDMGDAERLSRLRLAHAIMMFSRGVPTIYYGDEQGFVSDGGDRGARETMFPSQVPDYNDNDLIGTDATAADSNFDTGHPLYLAISGMATLRHAHAALRRGAQTVRHSDLDGGLLVLSRFDDETGREYVMAFNADGVERVAAFPVDGRSLDWFALEGSCATHASAPGSYQVRVPALDFVICYSDPTEQGS